MEEIFVTITGMNNYYGFKPFRVGKIFKLTKDEDNIYDCEAIRAEMPMIDTIGYVANSTKPYTTAHTVQADSMTKSVTTLSHRQCLLHIPR